jgi:hypothetical protein
MHVENRSKSIIAVLVVSVAWMPACGSADTNLEQPVIGSGGTTSQDGGGAGGDSGVAGLSAAGGTAGKGGTGGDASLGGDAATAGTDAAVDALSDSLAKPDNADNCRAPTLSFYVALSGDDDANDGLSLSSPWRTLSKAVGGVPPGATIFVVPGDYGSESVVISQTGAADKHIRMTRCGDAGQIRLRSNSLGVGVGLRVKKDASYWEIEHFDIHDYQFDLLLDSSHITVRHSVASGYSQVGFYVGPDAKYNVFEECEGYDLTYDMGAKHPEATGFRIEGDYNQLLRCKAHRCDHFGVAIDANDGEVATGNTVDGGEYYDIPNDTSIACADAADTVVKNVVVHDGDSGLRAYGYASNTIFRDCTVYNMTNYGIMLKSPGTVSGCKVYAEPGSSCSDFGGAGIMVRREESPGDARDTLLRDNDVQCPGTYEYRYNGNTGFAILRDPKNPTYRVVATGDAREDIQLEYTTNRVFKDGTHQVSYEPTKSHLTIPGSPTTTTTEVYTVEAFTMTARPDAGTARVVVDTFEQATVQFVGSVTNDAHSVAFTVWGLAPLGNYRITRGGVLLTNQQADAQGYLSFQSDAWPEPSTFLITNTG